jgi:hypothetical protein
MRQAGNIFKHKWMDCERCGFSFPVTKLIRQNGRFVCTGLGTTECADIQGYRYFRDKVRFPKKEGYDDDPRGNEVID